MRTHYNGPDLIDAAQDLASVPGGENHEYDRALVELTATVLGLSDLMADDYDTVRRMILGR